MWCYQKPGFEALLLAELQRQQQCNQFCDTLIKTEGVSVPAHSCVLSAISPQISSSLSALPAPPTGQSRLLDFRALGTCTLLHLVRLLYSGQMAGEGEEERQEAVSAAARLGIHGLVEVTRGRREEGEGQHREEGVQTEPLIPGESEERRGRWRREEGSEGTFLWRETVSDGKKDTWTQTEELQVTTAPPSHPAASYETIDMGALQTLQQTEPHLLPPHVPYLPVSLVYEPDETQGRNTPSTDRCWAGDLEDNQLEQFHDNIPGYINYFLNPHLEEGPRRGRKSGRPAAGTGGTRRAATGERGTPRRPQAKTGGRRVGRGVLTQTVDVQSVGVSKLQKMFLQRWGVKTPRTGQGGGAAGRRLYLKTREQLKPAKSCQSKRRRGKEREFSQSGDLREGGESNVQLCNQDGLPVGRAKRTRAKQTSAPVSSPPLRFRNVHHALSNSSPVLHPSTSAVLMSPAASYLSPVPFLFHTASLPPAAPPPNEPEHIDRLLEEVMMGLDILPNNNSGGLNSQPLPSAGSSCTYASSGNVLTENKCVGSPPVLLETESSQVVGGGLGRGGGVSSAAVPVLQQQGEGELNDMLENFLQSFEQHLDRCSARDEMGRGSQSSTVAVLSKYRKTQTQTKAPRLKNTPRPLRCSQISELQQSDEGGTLQSCPQLSPLAPLKHAEETKKQYPFSPMKGRRRRKPVSSSKAREKTVHNRDKQLQQMPVVKLERSGPLPLRVTQRGRSCQSLEAESPEQTKSTPSSLKYPHGSWSMSSYPIRSRFREAHIMDSMPFLHEPLSDKKQPSDNQQPGPRRRRPKKNGLCSVSKGGSSMSSIQQQQSVNEQLEENQERQEEELNVQRQEKVGGAKRTGERRSVESDEETVDDAPAAKKVCFKPMAHPALQTSSETDRAESASTERENLSYADSSVRDCLQKGRGGKTARREESSEDEEMDVDEDDHNHQGIRESDPWVSPPSHSAQEIRLGSTGSCEDGKDEDVDVIGGSSPVPSPVIISWSDSSEVEEEETDEDVDVVGEKTVYAPSGLFTAMSKGELENTGLRCS